MAIIRLFIIAFVVLSVIFVCVSLYSRAARREKLERQWEEDGSQGDKDAFVRAGMTDYDGSLRKQLIWGVYVIPLVIVVAITYVVNYT